MAVVEAVSVTAVRGGGGQDDHHGRVGSGNPLVRVGVVRVRALNVREGVQVEHISRCVKHTCKHGNTAPETAHTSGMRGRTCQASCSHCHRAVLVIVLVLVVSGRSPHY